MTPETGSYLAKARQLLAEARAVLSLNLTEAAGRAAYFASFHAAQALIFHRTGRVAKTHSGVRSGFCLLVKDDPEIDSEFSVFFTQAYMFKVIADYEMGSGAVLPRERAQEAIHTATRLVERIAELVAPPAPAQTTPVPPT